MTCIDTTLAHYLMTLNSDQQIRETIRHYLGDREGVEEFIEGFSQNKEFEKGRGIVVGKGLAKKTKSGSGNNGTKGASVPAAGGAFSVLGGDAAAPTAAPKKSSKSKSVPASDPPLAEGLGEAEGSQTSLYPDLLLSHLLG